MLLFPGLLFDFFPHLDQKGGYMPNGRCLRVGGPGKGLMGCHFVLRAGDSTFFEDGIKLKIFSLEP